MLSTAHVLQTYFPVDWEYVHSVLAWLSPQMAHGSNSGVVSLNFSISTSGKEKCNDATSFTYVRPNIPGKDATILLAMRFSLLYWLDIVLSTP